MDDTQRIALEVQRRRLVLAGDDVAWQAWYDESFDPLYRYVLWRCAARHDWAEEITQETWMTAVRRMRDFDPARATFAVWLRGIAENVLKNHRRRLLRDRTTGSLDEVSTEAESEGPSETQVGVHDALGRLPDHYEAVLRAKYLDQQSVEVIAISRGESNKAIESLLGRARRAFRAAFRRGEDER